MIRLYGGFSFRRAGKDYGWALALAAVLLALFLMYTEQAPESAGIPLPGDTKIVAPASPGLVTAIRVCKLGSVSKRPTEGGDLKYVAIFGLDVIEWPDSPKGKQPLGLVNGEPIMLSDEVRTCLRERS